jgi:branched-subunit amino acid aminotransferase/4-amino-4-deoxychorismate lyase
MSSTPYVQANTDGALHPADQASISPLDRGFLYGDAIYEVWRTYNQVLFAWDRHWSRLERSAAALALELPWSADAILDEVRRTAAAFHEVQRGGDDLYIRLQVSRGAGGIGLDTALADRPRFVILVQTLRGLPPGALVSGLRLSIARELRRNPAEALNPAWKTGNYLNNILALREARSRGADEVILLNLHGEIAEAAVSNVAFVRDGEILTPPLEAGILAGITRSLVLDTVAAGAGLRAVEASIRPEELGAMEECFLMSTTRDIVPIGAIDEVRFRVGPDSVTSRLKAAFAAHANHEAAAHPERSLG